MIRLQRISAGMRVQPAVASRTAGLAGERLLGAGAGLIALVWRIVSFAQLRNAGWIHPAGTTGGADERAGADGSSCRGR
jgi:hypothetical protein